MILRFQNNDGHVEIELISQANNCVSIGWYDR